MTAINLKKNSFNVICNVLFEPVMQYFTIFSHPLFPLLVRIFEKCEQATSRNPNGDKPTEVFTSDSFSKDIEQFAQNVSHVMN